MLHAVTSPSPKKWELDIEPLLDYMLDKGCVELVFTDINVGDMGNLPPESSTQRFYVGLPGHIEFEFWMKGNDTVEHLQIRQSAMTLREIEENGNILPTVNLSTCNLPPRQSHKVNLAARKFLGQGKSTVRAAAQNTIAAMVSKVLGNFPPMPRQSYHRSHAVN
jgi:hypothetical protein